MLRSRPQVGALAAFVVALLLSPRPAPAASASGEAGTVNRILSVRVGGDELSLAGDTAEAVFGATKRARAGFWAGQSATVSVGSIEREGTDEDDSGTEDASEGDLSIDGLLGLTLVRASAGINLSPAGVSSTAESELAAVSIMDGSLSLDGLVTTSQTNVTDEVSEASRQITLDGVTVFELASLLDALGVDRLGLTCEAVENTAATLGMDASAACELLGAAEGAIADALAGLDTLESQLGLVTGGHEEADVQADRDAVASIACDPLALDHLTCVADALLALTALAAEYDVTLSDPTNLETSKAEVLAALDEILAAFDDLTVIQGAAADAAVGTCDEILAALESASASLSSLDPVGAGPVLDTAAADVSAGCDAIAAVLDEVMAAPVIRLDEVVISLTTSAAEGATTADVVASIGSIQIGLNDAAQIDDVAAGMSFSASFADDIAAIIEALAIDAPSPQVELFAIDTDHGRADTGVWFADATLAILELTLPAGPVTVSDDAPFAILDGAGEVEALGAAAGGFGAFGAGYGAVLAATVDVPEVVVRAGIFDAGSTFSPASDDDEDPDGDPDGDDDGDDGEDTDALPKTGGSGWPLDIGAAMLITAAFLRRSLYAR